MDFSLTTMFVVPTGNTLPTGSNSTNTLTSTYTIQGAPDLLIVNPTTGAVVKRWNDNILELSQKELLTELAEFAH